MRGPAERGGQSRYTEAYLRMQSETEVTDDFATHLAENSSGILDPDIIAESARPPGERAAYAAAISMAEPDFIATFADQAGPTIAWLKGFGLRFDFTFLILRLDIATKIYDPTAPTSADKWALRNFDTSANPISFNLGIGYPF